MSQRLQPVRDVLEALSKAWRAGSARFYEVRRLQRRRHLPDPLAK